MFCTDAVANPIPDFYSQWFWHYFCILLGSPTASGDDAQCWGCDEGDVEGDGNLLYLVSFLLLTYLLIFSVWFVWLCLRIVRCLWDIERKAAPHDTKGIIKWCPVKLIWFGDASHSASSSWCIIKCHLVPDWGEHKIGFPANTWCCDAAENLSIGISTCLDRWWRRKSCFILSFLHWVSWFAEPAFIPLRVELKMGLSEFELVAPHNYDVRDTVEERKGLRLRPMLLLVASKISFRFLSGQTGLHIPPICESRNNHCDCEVIWPLQACWILRSHLNSILCQLPFFPWPL